MRGGEVSAIKTRAALAAICLGACLVLLACPSGPSSSAKDKASGEEQVRTLERKVEFLTSLMSRRGLAADVLREVSSALPDRVWLTEVAFDSGRVRIKGNARSNSLVAEYISRLGERAGLAQVNLISSVQRGARNTGYEEFSVEAATNETRRAGSSGQAAASGSETVAALTARLKELEKVLPLRKDTADALRQFQQAANDSGMRIAKFAPGSEIPGEFYGEWPISIEAAGSRQGLGRLFDRINDLPQLWLMGKFSFKAVTNQDAASPIRAMITAQTYLLREAESAGFRH
jgi:hypothetical protein